MDSYSQVEYEKFIRNIAFDFAIASQSEIKNLIDFHLRSVCLYLKKTRAAILLYDDILKERVVIHEYLDSSLENKVSILGNKSLLSPPGSITKLIREGKFLRILERKEMPTEAKDEIMLMETLSIESYFVVPIQFGDKIIGSVGFGSEKRQLNLPSELSKERELELGQTFAKIIASQISRNQILDELDREQNLLNSIMESSTTAIIVLEKTGKIIYANPVSEEILGISLTDIVNRTYDAPQWKATAIDGGPWTDEDQPFTKVLKTEKPVTDIRHAIEDDKGKKRYLSINGSPIFNDTGELSRLVFLVTDITTNVLKDIALQESEFRYRTVTENSLSLVYELDLITNQISWAGAVKEITGYTFEEYQSVNFDTWTTFIHAEDLPFVIQSLEKSIADKQRFFLEYRYRKRDGSYIHVEDQGIVLYNKNDTPFRMLGAIVDRTERYNALSELKNKEETLRMALQSASMGIWVWDLESKIVTLSDRVYEIYDLKPEDFNGNYESMLFRIHPEEREKIALDIKTFVNSNDHEDEYFFQYRLLLENSQIRWVEGNGKLFRDKLGNPMKMLGTISDITERKKSESILKESEQRFQTFYQFSNEAILIFKEDNLQVVDINQAFTNLFHYPKNEIKRKNYKKLISSHTFREIREKLALGGFIKPIEVIAFKKDQIPFPAQIIARKYQDKGQTFVAFNIVDTSAFKEVVELRQINDEISLRNRVIENQKAELEQTLENLKKTQSQLVQSEKMALLGQLVAGVAHEINNPIGAIKASNHNLEQWSNKFKDVYEPVQIALRELNDVDKNAFAEILKIAITSNEFYVGMQERQIKKNNIALLENLNFPKEKLESIASRWVEIGIGNIDPRYDSLLRNQNIELFLEYFNLESIYYRNTRTIHTAINRVSKIIYALKNFSHFDKQGKIEMVSVLESIEVVVTIYQNQFKKGVELIKEYDDVPLIKGYPDDLLHIWTNLIYNSFQAMEFQGAITIRVKNLIDTIMIEVRDNGPGIPEEFKSQIFDPFFTTKKIGEGSGLGLDIAKKIVDKHKGRLEFTSKPGDTSFFVYLPK